MPQKLPFAPFPSCQTEWCPAYQPLAHASSPSQSEPPQTQEGAGIRSVLDDCVAALTALGSDQESLDNVLALAKLIRNAVLAEETIYLTGVGKPGYVAQKNAATLKSLMVDGQFLDPCLAGHGDLGPVALGRGSLLVALSKSGCSAELHALFRQMRQLRPRCRIVLVCMSDATQLARVRACGDVDLVCHVRADPRELDGHGIVPATSNVLFEAVLSMAIAEAFRCPELGALDMCRRLRLSHPAGALREKVERLLGEL